MANPVKSCLQKFVCVKDQGCCHLTNGLSVQTWCGFGVALVFLCSLVSYLLPRKATLYPCFHTLNRPVFKEEVIAPFLWLRWTYEKAVAALLYLSIHLLPSLAHSGWASEAPCQYSVPWWVQCLVNAEQSLPARPGSWSADWQQGALDSEKAA